MNAGAWIVLIAIAAAVTFGLYRAAVDGRFRGTHRIREVQEDQALEPAAESVLADTPWAAQLGERATLLQFSSAFCAPCRTTRHVLADVAARNEGVSHLEIDAEHHLDLVRRLGIMRTPTTLFLDAHGRERTRASGAPRREQVEATLEPL